MYENLMRSAVSKYNQTTPCGTNTHAMVKVTKLTAMRTPNLACIFFSHSDDWCEYKHKLLTCIICMIFFVLCSCQMIDGLDNYMTEEMFLMK